METPLHPGGHAVPAGRRCGLRPECQIQDSRRQGFRQWRSVLSGAIIYLQDSKANAIRSFIATQDGSYRFGQISPDIDYTVWAKYNEVKSPTKTISSFDSRKNVTIDLHIKTNK